MRYHSARHSKWRYSQAQQWEVPGIEKRNRVSCKMAAEITIRLVENTGARSPTPTAFDRVPENTCSAGDGCAGASRYAEPDQGCLARMRRNESPVPTHEERDAVIERPTATPNASFRVLRSSRNGLFTLRARVMNRTRVPSSGTPRRRCWRRNGNAESCYTCAAEAVTINPPMFRAFARRPRQNLGMSLFTRQMRCSVPPCPPTI